MNEKTTKAELGVIRDRVKRFVRVKGRDLAPNPKNFRAHPQAQRDAMKAVLAEVGFAGAVLARETDAGLMLIDGHLRAEVAPDEDVPVLVLDVTAEEADKILATYDALTGMAEKIKKKRRALLRDIKGESLEFKKLLAEMGEDGDASTAADGEKPELEISPELFERHDYFVIYFDNEFDWQVACELFGVKTVQCRPNCTSTMKQKGLSRVIPGKQLLGMLGK